MKGLLIMIIFLVTLSVFAESNKSEIFLKPMEKMKAEDYHPQLKNIPNDLDNLTYYSWHIHVYFYQKNSNSTKACLSLRKQFMEYFNVPKCIGNCFMGGPFDNCSIGTCVWDPFFDVDGPHPYAQWGVYLDNDDLSEALTWMSNNHREFPVLFHPNTGLMVGDHDENRRAVWISPHPVHLDLGFLIWLQCKWFGCNDGVTLNL